MKLERVDRLTAPPVVGKYYLVPVVRYRRSGTLDDWPVMGPLHEDGDHLNFPHKHYHPDIRFFNARQFKREEQGWRTVWINVVGTPVGAVRDAPDPGPPEWRRRKCARAEHNWPVEFAGHPKSNFPKLWRAFKGRQCARNAQGFVCPHRHFPLGSIAAIDGVITCPLHGLRISAETGEVLAIAAAEADQEEGR